MPVFQLILTSDTINEGREKINVAFSATTGLWSGSTGFQSLIYNNGTGNIASGDYAIATGSGSTASGDVSFTQGIGNLASGVASHAEGGVLISTIFIGTSATTFSAHAEGVGTLASGIGSHAEGGATTASGNGSHAEGGLTIASGIYSHAEGNSTIASGSTSHAEGNGTIAQGNGSHSEGGFTTAFGSNSHAEGQSTSANGIASHAQGRRTIADGNYSFAGGKGGELLPSFEPILAEGETSFAFYHQDATTFPNFGVRADYSVILGGRNHFIGDSLNISSCILGGENNSIQNTNLGFGSAASVILGGRDNVIDSDLEDDTFCSAIISGENNIIDGNGKNSVILGGNDNRITSQNSAILAGSDHQITTLNAVILGGFRNIIPNSRNNSIIAGQNVVSRSANTFSMGFAFIGPPSVNNNTIALNYTDGSLYYNGSLNSGGADYAEFFEWNDGNPLNENRVGYFVSLQGNGIEINNYNIIGIISSNPSVAGDSAELKWNDIFQKDEWGNNLQEKFEVYEIEKDNQNFKIYIDENRNVYTEPPSFDNLLGELYFDDISNKKLIEVGYSNKINPLYNKNQSYIPRRERPEWSTVGLLGKLHVRTAESITGSTISANSDGMAINGSDYHVLKQITDFNEDKGYGVVQILFK